MNTIFSIGQYRPTECSMEHMEHRKFNKPTACCLFHGRISITQVSGFGGLEVACWPLVSKFAGSNPAEAVGFFRAKKSSVQPFVQFRIFAACKRRRKCMRGSRNFRSKLPAISRPSSSSFHY